MGGRAARHVRMFVWLALHDCILSNINPVRRDLTNNPSCGIYRHARESIEYIRRSCPNAKGIWRFLAARVMCYLSPQALVNEWIVDIT